MDENPTNVIIAGLMTSIWEICGEGSYPIWRSVADIFYDLIAAKNDMNSYESSLAAVKDYWEKYDTLKELNFDLDDGEGTIKAIGCAFMPIVDELDARGVNEEHNCPFFNTSLIAIENISGDIFEWERKREEYGNCTAHIKRI